MVIGVVVFLVLTSAGQAMASFCGEFPWEQVAGGSLPEKLVHARDAMERGMTKEAKSLLRDFILTSPAHPAQEGARFALSLVLHHGPETGQDYRETIEYLSSLRQQHSESVFGPWALCRIGNLYRQGGWVYEAQGIFEQFLTTYEGHPLTPGILISAGRNFLDQGQSLEAALVFRRVLDEPTWHEWYLQAALGLADSSASARAWEKAQYWYEAVQSENEHLVRQSPVSLYLRGQSEMSSGHPEKGLQQFLLAVNLHPHQLVAGKAMNHLTDYLLDHHAEVPGLWFAHEAVERFPGTVPGLRGRAALLRWAMKELEQGPDAVFDSPIRPRLAELGFAVPETWESFQDATWELIREAGALAPELAQEAAFWMVKSYQAQGRDDEAMQGFAEILRTHGESPWGQRSGEALRKMLEGIVTAQDWSMFGRFLDRAQDLIPLLGTDPELRFMLAESYRHMELPVQAMEWYDQVLAYRGHPALREEALRWKVVMALQAGELERATKAVLEYEGAYPAGKWLGDLALKVGQAALMSHEYALAAAQYQIAAQYASAKEERVYAGKQKLWALQKAGKLSEAIAGYRRLIANGAAETRDRLRLADLLFENKEYVDAGREYQAIVSVLEEDELRLWARYRLALSYQRAGRIPEAKALFTEVATTPAPDGAMAHAIVATATATVATHLSRSSGESRKKE